MTCDQTRKPEIFEPKNPLTENKDYSFHLTSLMAANTSLIYLIVLDGVLHCNYSRS